jgi:hypothetical protein
MRDAFLGTLLGIAVIVIAGYVVLLVKALTSKTGPDGCLLSMLAWFVFLIAAAIFGFVGHAVGLDTSGWW